ncbi:DIL domain-containing protein [Cantharellus anzutake]|uniref:DIL domain-containing protein n=1 Tax=Cantharellus anzutake TaxID=1750568 RepID=UPI001903B2DA|nr:DIL domain-containing protein [Cantharellus anzutake]KAF8344223.1 DIL domain-containing protein [Cantharellus anzutake]
MDWQQLDLAPPYPTSSSLTAQLKSNILTTEQLKQLVQHSIGRACLFADLPLLSFLLESDVSKNFADLNFRDDNGVGILSQSVIAFGEQNDCSVDREECIRALIAHGASVDMGDDLGWTPLHYAALCAPPSLILYLLKSGASPLAKTKKSLTPLDLIASYDPIPERQDAALILREAMRERGWIGSPLDLRRQKRERKQRARRDKLKKRAGQWNRIGHVLGISDHWWSGRSSPDLDSDDENDPMSLSDDEDDLEDELMPDEELTPPKDCTSFLAFSPDSVPSILQSVIVDADPAIHPITTRSAPANAIYLLSRFACLYCDELWFDTLITSAVDRIEQVVYNRPDRHEDMAHLTFWLYNSTILLHLLRCDRDLHDMCESLDLYSLLEELVNAIYVFIVRGTEQRLDPLIDAALLDYSPLASEFENIQFESEWSFFKSLTPKRRTGHSSISSAHSYSSSVASLDGSPMKRPASPVTSSSAGAKALNSLRQTIGRSSHPPLSTTFPPSSPAPTSTTVVPVTTPLSLTSVLTSIHSLLTLYSINPIIIIQAHTQIMYWLACEVFNRIINRKKYLCRSRALQIGLNVSVLEEWTGNVGLPSGVCSHFQGVRELLTWLQCHSSIDQFPALIDTIQTMKALNPFQMRRAVRDYRYEVGEGRMSEECLQYLAQLQKDWERRRVRMGVEALKKEIADRSRDRADSVASGRSGHTTDHPVNPLRPTTPADDGASETLSHESNRQRSETQKAVDALFDRNRLKNEWSAPTPPNVLGELLDSTYMLPLSLPSDPELLSAWPERKERRRQSRDLTTAANGEGPRSASRASVGHRGEMKWRMRSRTVRQVLPSLVQWVDGGVSVTMHEELEESEALSDGRAISPVLDADGTAQAGLGSPARIKPLGEISFTLPRVALRRHGSSRIPRESSGADTIVPSDYNSRDSLTPERSRRLSHDQY